MKQEKLAFDSGLVELEIGDSGRTIRFNPADAGFAETLYELAAKLKSIHESRSGQAEESAAAQFEQSRAEDREMREAVDAVFGEGFCGDVFPSMRLSALAEGLTVVENLIFALMDRMDDGITANLAARDGRIAKYTAKYSKYKKFKK